MITKHVSDTAGVPWGHRPTLRPAATATQGQAGSAPRLRVSPGLRREVGPASHPTACHFQRVLPSCSSREVTARRAHASPAASHGEGGPTPAF